jgi:rhodanese-related sulfurtransferase
MNINYKKIFLESAIILVLSVFVGFVHNATSENGISLIYKPISVESGSLISLEQAYKIYKEGQAIFIDSRHDEEFKEGHIRGAINLPINSSREEKVKILMTISKEQLIVTYCDGSECSSSMELAGQLMQLGYQKVLIFFGGWNEWEKAGNPIMKSNHLDHQ